MVVASDNPEIFGDIFEDDCRTDSEFRGAKRRVFSPPVSSQFIRSGLGIGLDFASRAEILQRRKTFIAWHGKVRRRKRPSRESEDSIKQKSRLNTKDGLTVRGSSRTVITSHRSSRILFVAYKKRSIKRIGWISSKFMSGTCRWLLQRNFSISC